MNGFEEIQAKIENFAIEKNKMQNQINKIEEKRNLLAEIRNKKKKDCINNEEVSELGREISKLGNQSQELQNKLDSCVREIKFQVNFEIDNLVAEGIRRIRKISGEIQEIEKINLNQKDKEARYELQCQEFYERFGRIPELSENALRENKIQEEIVKNNLNRIEELKEQINEDEEEITLLAKTKSEIKNGNWNFIKQQNEEIRIEEVSIQEIDTIEIEEFEGIEELYIEEFEPIEELDIEEFRPTEELKIEEIKNEEYEKENDDPIEELAKMIVEEIATEQTKCKQEENKVEERNKEAIKKDKVIIPLFGQAIKISNITVTFEDDELVYKAKISNDETVKIYPSKIGTENVILRDKQNREECKEILINYAVSEYKTFDKKVINKIDPLVCELLIECAQKYKMNAQELIYNYAMSFSYVEEVDMDEVPEIVYNLSYINQSILKGKEKAVLRKICKNTKRNVKIDIIESFKGINKIKYIFKRLFNVNNVKVLPDSKY